MDVEYQKWPLGSGTKGMPSNLKRGAGQRGEDQAVAESKVQPI